MAPRETLRVARPDGAELNVRVDGQGPIVLSISGLGGTAGFWRPVVDDLARSCTFVSLDQRGIGASSRGSAPVSIETLAEDCWAVLDVIGARQAVVVGHSTGGCIAMTMAADAPERVVGAVLSATWLTATPYMRTLFAARQSMLETDGEAYATIGTMLGYPSDWLEAHWSVLEAALSSAPRTAGAKAIVRERIAALLAFDGRTLAPRLTMPCLVFGARDDLIVPFSAQQSVHAAIAHAEFEALPAGGHFFPVTRRRDFCARLATFIGERR